MLDKVFGRPDFLLAVVLAQLAPPQTFVNISVSASSDFCSVSQRFSPPSVVNPLSFSNLSMFRSHFGSRS